MQIFHPFKQEKSSDSSFQPGTGLGLSITKHLAEAMDGSVEFDSELDKGTEFRVTLKLTKPEPHSIPQEPKINRQDIVVALYDGHAISGLSLLHKLERWGVAVEHFKTSDQLINSLINHPQKYSLVVLGFSNKDIKQT